MENSISSNVAKAIEAAAGDIVLFAWGANEVDDGKYQRNLLITEFTEIAKQNPNDPIKFTIDNNPKNRNPYTLACRKILHDNGGDLSKAENRIGTIEIDTSGVWAYYPQENSISTTRYKDFPRGGYGFDGKIKVYDGIEWPMHSSGMYWPVLEHMAYSERALRKGLYSVVYDDAVTGCEIRFAPHIKVVDGGKNIEYPDLKRDKQGNLEVVYVTLPYDPVLLNGTEPVKGKSGEHRFLPEHAIESKIPLTMSGKGPSGRKGNLSEKANIVIVNSGEAKRICPANSVIIRCMALKTGEFRQLASHGIFEVGKELDKGPTKPSGIVCGRVSGNDKNRFEITVLRLDNEKPITHKRRIYNIVEEFARNFGDQIDITPSSKLHGSNPKTYVTAAPDSAAHKYFSELAVTGKSQVVAR